jgi:hypothetical protein
MKRLSRKEENCLVRYIVDKFSSVFASDITYEVDKSDKYVNLNVLSYYDVQLVSRPSFMYSDKMYMSIKSPIEYRNFRWLNSWRLQKLFVKIREQQQDVAESEILNQKRKNIQHILNECK